MKAEFGWIVQPKPTRTQSLADFDRDVHAFIGSLGERFGSLWVEDHLQDAERPLLECWTLLTYLAATYTHLKVGTLVMAQSFRNPALLAKMAATLQYASHGRLILGIGAGWKDSEYRAYGYSFPPAGERVRHLAESARVIRSLWQGGPVTAEGPGIPLQEAYCEPRPDPFIPLMIGGTGDYLLRAVVRHADWWNGGWLSPEDYGARVERLNRLCADAGRDPATLALTYAGIVTLSEHPLPPEPPSPLYALRGTPDEVAAVLRKLMGLGVRHFMLRFTDFPSRSGLALFQDHVLPQLV